ncbi:hypothetical protein DXG01_001658 [Tephrocybe rancida]|nr:hypothetical protein DXG01_001658 [Tephrocybe rancida]
MNPPTTPFQPGLSSVPVTPSYSTFSTPTPAPRGRPRGSFTGAKRGRKPRGGATGVGSFITRTPQDVSTTPAFSTSQYSQVNWATQGTIAGTSTGVGAASTSGAVNATGTASTSMTYTTGSPAPQGHYPNVTPSSYTPASTATSPSTSTAPNYALPTVPGSGTSSLDATGLIRMSSSTAPVIPLGVGGMTSATGTMPLARPAGGGEDDGDGEDEMLPAMADDDYSAQLSWQSQSKDNLKVLMDNFSPAQYERFEAYRRHALPKAAVRKVIQQTLGQQVSQPVAQIVAGFSKVFVGEIVEKARAVQARRGESGPLSPDHLREAYRIYQDETGRVGAARPLRSKKLFVR